MEARVPGKPFRFLDCRDGLGQAMSGGLPDAQDQRVETPLILRSAGRQRTGTVRRHPRVAALRDFITGCMYRISPRAAHAGSPRLGLRSG